MVRSVGYIGIYFHLKLAPRVTFLGKRAKEAKHSSIPLPYGNYTVGVIDERRRLHSYY